MRSNGFKVPPLSVDKIHSIATNIRNYLHPQLSSFIDIVQVLEIALPQLFPDFCFEVCEPSEMEHDHGRTYPDKAIIQIREDIYEGAVAGLGRDRFTLAHELGHFVLHQNIPFSHNLINPIIKIYENSEWQADTFASAFLMPDELVKLCKNANEIAKKCKVSISAAKIRILKK